MSELKPLHFQNPLLESHDALMCLGDVYTTGRLSSPTLRNLLLFMYSASSSYYFPTPANNSTTVPPGHYILLTGWAPEGM